MEQSIARSPARLFLGWWRAWPGQRSCRPTTTTRRSRHSHGHATGPSMSNTASCGILDATTGTGDTGTNVKNATARKSKTPHRGIVGRGFTGSLKSDSVDQDTVAVSIIKPCKPQAQAKPRNESPTPARRYAERAKCPCRPSKALFRALVFGAFHPGRKGTRRGALEISQRGEPSTEWAGVLPRERPRDLPGARP